jgi:hypothetical protein
MKKNYTLCEGTNCPIKERCARYLPDLVRSTTDYFDPIPYDHNRRMPHQKTGEMCGQFEPDKLEDILKNLN